MTTTPQGLDQIPEFSDFLEASDPKKYQRTFKIAKFALDHFASVRYHGLDNIPQEGGAILAIKHAHMSDIPVSGVTVGKATGRAVRFVAKEELFKLPLIGSYIRDHDTLEITRDDPKLSQLAAMVTALRDGHLLGLYPEGTRIRGKKVGELKEGLELLVRRAEVPVIPIGLGGFLIRQIGVSVGAPIRLEDYKNAAPKDTSKKTYPQFVLDYTRKAMQHELDNAFSLARYGEIR